MLTDHTFLNVDLDRLINSVLTGITFLFKRIRRFFLYFDNHFNVIGAYLFFFLQILSLKELDFVYH